MKTSITAATLGLASCKVGEFSLANNLQEKALAESIRNERFFAAQQLAAEEEERKGYGTVKNGACFKLKSDWQFWDLKLLESGAAESAKEIGSDISGKRNDADETYLEGTKDFDGRFMYKVCQSSWDYPHSQFDAPKEGEEGDEEWENFKVEPEQ